MNFKKVSLGLTFTFGLFFSNQTLPMNNNGVNSNDVNNNGVNALEENLRLRFPNDLNGKDAETTGVLKKVGSIRYSKNKEMKEQAFQKNPNCSFCGNSLLKSSSYITCILCLKAFYCDSDCQDNDHKCGHKDVCLKSILEEKEAKSRVAPTNKDK